MLKQVLSAAVVFGGAALAPPALAQGAPQACGPREAITVQLEQKYGEHQQGAGVMNSNRVFELWHSEKTGTWTILLTRPNGTSCIVAAGDFWKLTPQDLTMGNPI